MRTSLNQGREYSVANVDVRGIKTKTATASDIAPPKMRRRETSRSLSRGASGSEAAKSEGTTSWSKVGQTSMDELDMENSRDSGPKKQPIQACKPASSSGSAGTRAGSRDRQQSRRPSPSSSCPRN